MGRTARWKRSGREGRRVGRQWVVGGARASGRVKSEFGAGAGLTDQTHSWLLIYLSRSLSAIMPSFTSLVVLVGVLATLPGQQLVGALNNGVAQLPGTSVLRIVAELHAF